MRAMLLGGILRLAGNYLLYEIGLTLDILVNNIIYIYIGFAVFVIFILHLYFFYKISS